MTLQESLVVPDWATLLAMIFLALVLGAVSFRAVVLYRRLQGLKEGVYPTPRRITESDTLRAQRVLGTFEDVSFTTSDALVLRGWYKPSPTNGATVVFIHGKSNNRCVLLDEAAALSSKGFGVLLYDSRASGESDGHLHSWGHEEQRDLTAAIDFLDTRSDADSSRTGVFGFSVGANTALMVAANDKRIKAVIISGPSPSLEIDLWHVSSRPKCLTYWLLLRTYRKAGVHIEDVRPVDQIARLSPRPLLMIRGTGSVTTPVAKAQLLFDQAREPKELYVIDGADHNDYLSVGGQRYLSKLTDFFVRNL